MMWALCFVLMGVGVALIWRAYRKRQWRKAVLESRLTRAEWDIIRTAVPSINKLPPDLTPAFEGKVALFLDQVELIGCNGLDVT